LPLQGVAAAHRLTQGDALGYVLVGLSGRPFGSKGEKQGEKIMGNYENSFLKRSCISCIHSKCHFNRKGRKKCMPCLTLLSCLRRYMP
jgi:hypothetical protein